MDLSKKKDEHKRPALCRTSDDFYRYVKGLHDRSSHMGDVVNHITIDSKDHEPYKENMEIYDNDEEDEDDEEKTFRQLRNKSRIAINQKLIEYAKEIINEIDLVLSEDVRTFIKTEHPEYRRDGNVNAYIRLAARGLVSLKTLTPQQREKEKEDSRRTVRSLNIYSVATIDKLWPIARTVQGSIALLGLDYSAEEIMFDMLESFKGELSQVKCHILDNTVCREREIATVPAGANRNQRIREIEAKYVIPTTIEELSRFVRNFNFPSASNEISQFTQSLATMQTTISVLTSMVADKASLSTASKDTLKKLGVLKKEKRGKDYYKDVTCTGCGVKGHSFHPKFCPSYAVLKNQKVTK